MKKDEMIFLKKNNLMIKRSKLYMNIKVNNGWKNEDMFYGNGDFMNEKETMNEKMKKY